MRLSEMHYRIGNVLDNWIKPVIQEKTEPGNGSPFDTCENAVAICNLLTPIQYLPEVKECLRQLRDVSLDMVNGNPHYLDFSDCNRIIGSVDRLHGKLTAMYNMCEMLGMNREAEGFDVKLPPNITLRDAAQCMEDLDLVFSQCPAFPSDNQIKFSGVDIGSTWLTFIIAGAGIAAILRTVAELVDKAIAIRYHQMKCREEQERLRSLQLSNDMIEPVVAAHKAALEKMTADAVQELSAKHGVTENEEQERLRVSLDRLVKWMNRGMEIHAGINAPEETKLLFPPIERQSLPQEIIKALGEAKQDE